MNLYDNYGRLGNKYPPTATTNSPQLPAQLQQQQPQFITSDDDALLATLTRDQRLIVAAVVPRNETLNTLSDQQKSDLFHRRHLLIVALAAINQSRERRTRIVQQLQNQTNGVNNIINVFIAQESQKIRDLKSLMATIAVDTVNLLGEALIEFQYLLKRSNLSSSQYRDEVAQFGANALNIGEINLGAAAGDRSPQQQQQNYAAAAKPFLFEVLGNSSISQSTLDVIKRDFEEIQKSFARVTANVLTTYFAKLDEVRYRPNVGGKYNRRAVLRNARNDAIQKTRRVFNWIGVNIDRTTHRVSVRSGIPVIVLQSLMLLFGSVALHTATPFALMKLAKSANVVLTRISSTNSTFYLQAGFAVAAVSWLLYTIGAYVGRGLGFFSGLISSASPLLNKLWPSRFSKAIARNQIGDKMLKDMNREYVSPETLNGPSGGGRLLGGAGGGGQGTTGSAYDPVDEMLRSYFLVRVTNDLAAFCDEMIRRVTNLGLSNDFELQAGGILTSLNRVFLTFFDCLFKGHHALSYVTNVINMIDKREYTLLLALAQNNEYTIRIFDVSIETLKSSSDSLAGNIRLILDSARFTNSIAVYNCCHEFVIYCIRLVAYLRNQRDELGRAINSLEGRNRILKNNTANGEQVADVLHRLLQTPAAKGIPRSRLLPNNQIQPSSPPPIIGTAAPVLTLQQQQQPLTQTRVQFVDRPLPQTSEVDKNPVAESSNANGLNVQGGSGGGVAISSPKLPLYTTPSFKTAGNRQKRPRQ